MRAPVTAGISESIWPFSNTRLDGLPAASGPAWTASCSKLRAALLAAARAAASAGGDAGERIWLAVLRSRIPWAIASAAVWVDAAGAEVADASGGAIVGDTAAGISDPAMMVTAYSDS
jgi:hypothetical protein